MELLLVLTILILGDLAALHWGRDSRDPARGHTGAGGLL
jgi:hypothetical protein